MINFVEDKYGVSVSCAQINQDGYEVGNLIVGKNVRPNRGFSFKNTGFLAEYFMKPPVEIIFRFQLPLEVSTIYLGLRVGAQITDGIELLVSQDYNATDNFQSVYYQCPIGKVHLAVTNNNFRPRPPFLEICKEPGHPINDTLKSTFKAQRHLYHVRALKVRIVKTSASSVPALGCIKVWGQPARSCKAQEVNRIMQLYSDDQCDSDSDVQILPTLQSVVPKNGTSPVQVPEEFTDPLTCDLMVLPVLLPSGQCIDRSTLEKASQSQASWGHVPCDPFTGIPFGPGRQPISNAPLKARIDAFLIKNSHLDPALSKTPRTTGNPSSKKICELFKPPAMVNRGVASVTTTSQKTLPIVHRESAPKVLSVPSEPGNILTEPSPHELALESSLQVALQSVPEPTTVGPLRSSHCKNSACVGCRLGQSAALYKVPCGHHHCRTCLSRTRDICLQCSKGFSKGQVLRVYT